MGRRADYNAITRQMTVSGDEGDIVLDLTQEDDRSTLREMAGDIDEIVSRDMSVYQTGWAQAVWGIHPDSLESYAASMANQPHYLGHDSGSLYGRTGVGRVETLDDGHQRLVQDLHYTTPDAIQAVVHGGDLRASIGASRTEASRMICSICDGEWLADDCDHWVGDVSEDGKPWMLLITNMVARETSTTNSPSSAGTGSDASAEVLTLDAPQIYQRLPHLAVEYMRSRMEARAKERVSEMALSLVDLRESVTELTARVADISAERDQARAAADQLAEAAALKAVRVARQRKGLRTPKGMALGDYEASLVDMYRHSRATWDMWLASLPDSQLSETITGADPAAPIAVTQVTADRGTPAWHNELARQAREIAAETGEDGAAVLRRLRQEQS